MQTLLSMRNVNNDNNGHFTGPSKMHAGRVTRNTFTTNSGLMMCGELLTYSVASVLTIHGKKDLVTVTKLFSSRYLHQNMVRGRHTFVINVLRIR